MEEFIASLVGKEFRFSGFITNDKKRFRIGNSGPVYWVEISASGRGDTVEWSHHCDLIVMDTYISAYSRFLNQYLDKRLHKKDFLLID